MIGLIRYQQRLVLRLCTDLQQRSDRSTSDCKASATLSAFVDTKPSETDLLFVFRRDLRVLKLVPDQISPR